MNKILIIYCLIFLNASAYNPGPQINEFAHNPITPGYGISNYFELMPDKVLSNKVAWSAKKLLSQSIKTVTISGNMIHIELQKSYRQEPLQIYLYTISGKKVHQFSAPEQQSSGALLLIPFPNFAKGVYFLCIETKTERINTKFVYLGR